MKNNFIFLSGNVGRDAETRSVSSGSVTHFSVATNDGYYDKGGNWVEVSTWHHVEAWGKLAESCSSIKKGSKVIVRGKMKYGEYVDKDGNKVKTADVVASDVDVIKQEKKSSGSGDRYSNSQPAPTEREEDLNGDDDGLPF